MNILYLINYAGNGGSEKYVKILSDAMQKKGAKIFLAYNEGNGDILDFISPNYQINMKHPFDLLAAKKLSNLCDKLNIDIIHAQFPRENYISILSNIFKKRVVVYTSHINQPNNFMWRMTNKFLTKKNAAIISVCNSVKNLLIENNYPKEKIHVIYNGITPEIEKNEIQKNDVFTFVTLARLSEEKGLMLLLESMKVVIESGSNCYLKIAGSGPLQNQLQEYITTNNLQNNIFLLGHVDTTKDLLLKSHVYINSSVHEALSFGILEAMSVGLPIIATRVGGNIDIIENANNGILVDRTTENMSQAMKIFVNLKNDYKYNQNSIEATKTVFSLERTTNMTYEIYKKTIEEDYYVG